MNFEPIMNDEQKEQARQLNLIGELDRLHRVNWELQHKVDGLTLLLNEKLAENEKLKDVLKNCIAALRHAYFHGFTELYKTTADEAAAAIRESGDE